MIGKRAGAVGSTALWLALAAAGCAAPGAMDGAQQVDDADIVLQKKALSAGVVAEGTVPFSVGMDLGVGMDVASQAVLSQADCLDFAGEAAEIESHSYATEISRYRVLRDKEELRELLDISAKMSGTFGVVRVGIEATYYDEIVRNDNSVYVLVQHDVLTRGYSIKDARMTVDGFDGLEGRPDNRDGSVPGTIRSYFRNDNDLFRRKCGDRYLHSVVTGGRYVAVLEVKTTNRYDKNLLEGELKGTYLPLMISITGRLELLLEELETNHEVRVHVVSRGDNRTDNVVSLSGLEQPDPMLVSELVDDVNRFRAAVIAADEAASTSPLGYRHSPMYAMFASYQSAANEVPGGGYPVEQLEQMRRYREAYERYTEVERTARQVLLQPERYQPANDLDVELVAREAHYSGQALERASSRCAMHTAPVCRPVDSLGLPTVQDLRERLPGPAPMLPRDCRQVRAMFGDTEDGDKLVYLGGRADQPFWLWCADMAEAEPVAYLSLGVFDPPSGQPGTNYARSLGGTDARDVEWPDRLSIYEKLQVHVSDDGLVVVPGQVDFVSDDTGATPAADEQVPWGSAFSCQRGRQLAAVADLSGTEFAFAEAVNHTLREQAFHLETEPANWFDAYRSSGTHDASLLHVASVEEQDFAASQLQAYGAEGAWLGMMNSRNSPRTFRWMDGVQTPYRNWAEGFPRARRGEQACAYIGSDGLFREGSCRVARPFIAESRRVAFDVGRPGDQQLQLHVDAKYSCGTVEPESELRLRYRAEPAVEP